MREFKGYSITFRGSGYEPCKVYNDLCIEYIYPEPLSLSGVDACFEALILAQQSGCAYSPWINGFKEA